MTRYLVVFEVYNPYSILQLSEVLSEFKIVMNDRIMYSGRAVISNVVNTGIMLVCEATLDESWLDVSECLARLTNINSAGLPCRICMAAVGWARTCRA